VVVRREPFQLTTDAATKSVPSTVNVKEDPPAPVDVGEIEVITGSESGVIVNVSPVEVPTPGFLTVTVELALPSETSAESMVAVI